MRFFAVVALALIASVSASRFLGNTTDSCVQQPGFGCPQDLLACPNGIKLFTGCTAHGCPEQACCNPRTSYSCPRETTPLRCADGGVSQIIGCSNDGCPLRDCLHDASCPSSPFICEIAFPPCPVGTVGIRESCGACVRPTCVTPQ